MEGPKKNKLEDLSPDEGKKLVWMKMQAETIKEYIFSKNTNTVKWVEGLDSVLSESYEEFQREGIVEERRFREFVPEYAHTYLKVVYDELCRHMMIGRMRLLKKKPFDANSWHRDPEARIHIPIITNPGSIMMINNHCTHMPADGYVYFTDTRGYHMAVNGGEQDRVHLVATLPESSVL